MVILIKRDETSTKNQENHIHIHRSYKYISMSLIEVSISSPITKPEFWLPQITANQLQMLLISTLYVCKTHLSRESLSSISTSQPSWACPKSFQRMSGARLIWAKLEWATRPAISLVRKWQLLVRLLGNRSDNQLPSVWSSIQDISSWGEDDQETSTWEEHFNDLKAVGATVTKNPISNTLHHNGLKSCSFCKVKKAHLQAHLQFASEHLNDSVKVWEKVLLLWH